MRPAQRARRCLRGNWLNAAAVECTRLGAGLLVLLGQLAALALLGLGAERVITAGALWSGGWLYGVVLLAMLLLDWLLVSPLLAGRALYYRRLAASAAPAPSPRAERERDALGRTQEIHLELPPAGSARQRPGPSGGQSGGEGPPYSLLFSFYRRGYLRTLRWRLGLFLRRLCWGALCYAPSALLVGYGELIRRGGSRTPLADLTLMLCTALGLTALLGGFVALELLMLRYLPAQYLLDSPEQRGLFRRARRIMRGRLGETVGLYLGFAGWLAACLAVLPYFYAAPLFHTVQAQAVRRFARHAGPEENHEPHGRRRAKAARPKRRRDPAPQPAGARK